MVVFIAALGIINLKKQVLMMGSDRNFSKATLSQVYKTFPRHSCSLFNL
ncbi:hypothetical protein AlmWB_02990 [Candidatus Phytoplasma phoenicium]|uniref:Uncharacterized protein n=2 Tax=Candidatus Phytoplasma phoenicium TaxID=198422 RepID=A0A0L0MKI3_9MOLU|nr:hypothetical protein AlmWB_02990 [Candidatus Phytoplasma phoenicium]